MSGDSTQQQLLNAIERADLALLEILVAGGADVNLPSADPDGETPLIRAVGTGQLAVVHLLVRAGADVNLPQKGGKLWTPLMFAHANPIIIRELLAFGADVNARLPFREVVSNKDRKTARCGGETALHLAAVANNAESVRLLIDAGADVEAGKEWNSAPLDYALRSGTMTEAIEALVEAGAVLTSRQLEGIHSAALDPDSALPEFWSAGAQSPGSHAAQREFAQGGLGKAPAPSRKVTAAELKCPKCRSLIYSRKSKICGNCGTLLPPELLLTDVEIEAAHEERRWARELANALGPGDSPECASSRKPTGNPVESVRPHELLRPLSYAAEFNHRKRPGFQLTVLASVFSLALFAYLSDVFGGIPILASLGVVGVLALACYQAWVRAAPICPNCKQNITTCAADHCHVCGKPLSRGRCGHCGTDYTWTGWFSSSQNRMLSRISYCPSCGAYLDSCVRRWRAGDDSA